MNQAISQDQLPAALYRADQVRELDRRAIEEQGIDGYRLMQRASTAALDVLCQRWPEVDKALIFCGAGNNGGDGLVLARLARARGIAAQVLMLADPEKLRGAAAQALQDFLSEGGEIHPFNQENLSRLKAQAEVAVDAMLGTGLSRPVAGDYQLAIEALQGMHEGGVGVLALDIPSGLNADTGAIMGGSVIADCTVSFIGLKLGLLTGEGPHCSGQVYFSDLDVPASTYAELPPAALRIDRKFSESVLPMRKRTAHKGQQGHVLCIGGDHGTAGAIRIAAEAALRSGAGLVSVATRADVATAMSQTRPELMAIGVEQAMAMPELIEAATVLLLGPGLGQADWGRSLWSAAMASDMPMVVDADGLNLLAESPASRDNWVLTPHPGEAARLLACSNAEIQADRPAAARALQDKYGGVIVLKGAGTLVQVDSECCYLCSAGNPGMAVGGMGDLLGGVIAGLVAQGLDMGMAATLGVDVHARAGDAAVAELGERGLLPTDLWPYLRRLLND